MIEVTAKAIMLTFLLMSDGSTVPGQMYENPGFEIKRFETLYECLVNRRQNQFTISTFGDKVIAVQQICLIREERGA